MVANQQKQMEAAQTLHNKQMEVMAQNQQKLMERLIQLDVRLGAGPVPHPQGQAASSEPAASSPGAASSGEVPPHLQHQAVPVNSYSPVQPLGSATAIEAARLARLLLGKLATTLAGQVGVDPWISLICRVWMGSLPYDWVNA